MAQRGEPFAMAAPVGNGLDVGGKSASAAADTLSAAAAAVKRREASAGEPAVDADMAAAAGLLLRPDGGGDDEAAAAAAAAPPSADTLRAPGETTIDSIFTVPGVGTVVAGTVLKGCIHVGSTMLLGPDRSGEGAGSVAWC